MGEEMTPDRKREDIRFTVSPANHTYLGWLVKNTVLGNSENEVAKHLLTRRLAEMRQEDYRDNSSE